MPELAPLGLVWTSLGADLPVIAVNLRVPARALLRWQAQCPRNRQPFEICHGRDPAQARKFAVGPQRK